MFNLKSFFKFIKYDKSDNIMINNEDNNCKSSSDPMLQPQPQPQQQQSQQSTFTTNSSFQRIANAIVSTGSRTKLNLMPQLSNKRLLSSNNDLSANQNSINCTTNAASSSGSMKKLTEFTKRLGYSTSIDKSSNRSSPAASQVDEMALTLRKTKSTLPHNKNSSNSINKIKGNNHSMSDCSSCSSLDSTSATTASEEKAIKHLNAIEEKKPFTDGFPQRIVNKSMTTGSKALRIMGNNSMNQSQSKGSAAANAAYIKQQQKRLFFKNGNINISRSNIDQRNSRYITDIFTTLIDIKWRYNLLIFSLGFLMSWLSFATIYFIISYIHGDFNHIDELNYTACISVSV
jgi:hypothetical protein